MANAHHCWGPHLYLPVPHPCRCVLGNDHQHEAYEVLTEDEQEPRNQGNADGP